jgi:hypothetical protein
MWSNCKLQQGTPRKPRLEAVQEIEVKVENDHIERLTTAKPILALSELIWNAYDADAHTVRVSSEVTLSYWARTALT